MIASVGNGGPVQRTDATRIAGDLLTRIDSRTSAVNQTAGREQDEGPRREDQTERKAGSERQVGDELAMQLQQSRLSRADAEAGLPATQTVSSLETNNDYLDRAARQMGSDDGASAEADAAAQLLLANSADGVVRADDNEFAIGIDRIDAGRNAQTGNAEKAEPAGRDSLAVAGSQGEPADLNRDGAIGPQESSAHQTRQTEPVQAEAETQQQRQAAERIATRLAQTYGRFDPEIANATLRVNPFHIAA